MFPRHLFLPPAVEGGGGPRLGVPGQPLHILERHPLRQQIGDACHTEGVRHYVADSSFEVLATVVSAKGRFGLR